MLTKTFWKAAAERAAKTAAQAALLAHTAGKIYSAWSVDWHEVAGFALGGAVLSLITSIASSRVGSDGPSLGTEVLPPKS